MTQTPTPNEKFDRYKRLQSVDWNDIRDISKYNQIVIDYPWGKRNALEPKTFEQYEDLQLSRGPCVTQSDSYDDYRPIMELNDADTLRLDELSFFCPQVFDDSHSKDFFEIGFRTPKLMKHFESTFRRVRGCDVVDVNVDISRRLGYNVVKCDITDPCGLDLSGVGLIVAYHVLEHVTDPFKTIKKLHEMIDVGTYGHFEVPIEPGMPRVRYAHMHAFERCDLALMIGCAGFKVLNISTQSHVGGPEIERVIFTKS